MFETNNKFVDLNINDPLPQKCQGRMQLQPSDKRHNAPFDVSLERLLWFFIWWNGILKIE